MHITSTQLVILLVLAIVVTAGVVGFSSSFAFKMLSRGFFWGFKKRDNEIRSLLAEVSKDDTPMLLASLKQELKLPELGFILRYYKYKRSYILAVPPEQWMQTHPHNRVLFISKPFLVFSRRWFYTDIQCYPENSTSSFLNHYGISNKAIRNYAPMEVSQPINDYVPNSVLLKAFPLRFVDILLRSTFPDFGGARLIRDAINRKDLTVPELHNLYFHPEEFQRTASEEFKGVPVTFLKQMYSLPTGTDWFKTQAARDDPSLTISQLRGWKL
jgi:hypothetical protein